MKCLTKSEFELIVETLSFSACTEAQRQKICEALDAGCVNQAKLSPKTNSEFSAGELVLIKMTTTEPMRGHIVRQLRKGYEVELADGKRFYAHSQLIIREPK